MHGRAARLHDRAVSEADDEASHACDQLRMHGRAASYACDQPVRMDFFSLTHGYGLTGPVKSVPENMI